MSLYVMSDIHGCYDTFLSMLEKIGFSDTDELILAGDYIDRGPQSYEMLQWIERRPPNVCVLRGNHEAEFAAYVELMLLLNRREKLDTDFSSPEDTAALYHSAKYWVRHRITPESSFDVFDLYGTIESLSKQQKITLGDLCRWADMIREMPYYKKLDVGGRICIIVHAGYAEWNEKAVEGFESREQFYLYAREESIRSGGVKNGTVVAGHTPTILKKEFAFTGGKVFRKYDAKKDCVFYNIDCGCVFRDILPGARLACLRLDDETIFYV